MGGGDEAKVGATYVVPVMLLSTIFARFGMHFWRPSLLTSADPLHLSSPDNFKSTGVRAYIP